MKQTINKTHQLIFATLLLLSAAAQSAPIDSAKLNSVKVICKLTEGKTSNHMYRTILSLLGNFMEIGNADQIGTQTILWSRNLIKKKGGSWEFSLAPTDHVSYESTESQYEMKTNRYIFKGFDKNQSNTLEVSFSRTDYENAISKKKVNFKGQATSQKTLGPVMTSEIPCALTVPKG